MVGQDILLLNGSPFRRQHTRQYITYGGLLACLSTYTQPAQYLTLVPSRIAPSRSHPRPSLPLSLSYLFSRDTRFLANDARRSPGGPAHPPARESMPHYAIRSLYGINWECPINNVNYLILDHPRNCLCAAILIPLSINRFAWAFWVCRRKGEVKLEVVKGSCIFFKFFKHIFIL